MADGLQLVAQHVTEELVVAVDAVPQRDDEQRRVVEPTKDRRRLRVAGHRRARARFQLVEYRRAQQEPAYVGRLMDQDLLDQVVAHDAGAPRELGEQAIRIGRTTQRDRRHLHPGHPAVDAIGEKSRRAG